MLKSAKARIFNTVERQFNALGWKELGIQTLDSVSQLPAEFRRIVNASQFEALSRPETTLCTLPLALSASSTAYLSTLTADAMTGDWQTPENINPRRVQASMHVYRMKIAALGNGGLQQPSAANISKLLTARLPEHGERDDLIADVVNLYDSVAQHIGPVSYFALAVAQGWMPPPDIYRPHEDNLPGLRLFANLTRSGPLVVPVSAVQSLRRVEHTLYGEEDMSTPVYPTFAQIGAGRILQVPPRHLAAWRGAGTYSQMPYGPALAHATPPLYADNGVIVMMHVTRPHWPTFKHTL